MVNEPSGNAMFDQDAARPPRASRAAVVASVVAALVVLGGVVFLLARPADEPGVAASFTDSIGASVLSSSTTSTTSTEVTTSAPVTTAPPPDTTVPPTSAAPTTSPPTTPPTTQAPTTVPVTTTPPTTVPPGPTTTLAIWALPPIPESAPLDGPGTPQIHREVFASGVRAVDVQPFFLRTQMLADAWAAGDFDLARSIDLRARAGDDYEQQFADLDRSSLILVDAGVSGGSYELLVIEVDVESGGDVTRLHCSQFAADGVTGNVFRRGAFELGTYDRNITPEELRHATEVFDGLLDRCTFGLVAARLD